MKKLICSLLTAALLAAPVALADSQAAEDTVVITELDGDIMTRADGIVELSNNTRIDLDACGTAELITYSLDADEYGTGKFTINVGDKSLTIDAENGIDALYAGRIGGDYDVIYLMVGEYGPSDDEYTYIVRYDEDGLRLIGGIGALPENIKLNGNVMTATVRGAHLQTWFRESDFVIAATMRYDENYEPLPQEYYVAEVPRTSYAMNTAVVLKRDVTVKKSLFGTAEMTFKAGDTVVLSATDDKSYVYLAATTPNDDGEGGYVMLDEDDFSAVILDGEAVNAADVFDGLLFAD